MELKYFGILRKVGTNSKPKLLPRIYDDYDDAVIAMNILVSRAKLTGVPESVAIAAYMIVELECHRYV